MDNGTCLGMCGYGEVAIDEWGEIDFDLAKEQQNWFKIVLENMERAQESHKAGRYKWQAFADQYERSYQMVSKEAM